MLYSAELQPPSVTQNKLEAADHTVSMTNIGYNTEGQDSK